LPDKWDLFPASFERDIRKGLNSNTLTPGQFTNQIVLNQPDSY